MTRPAEILGQRFARLVVIEQSASENDKTRWLCRCDCGNVLTTTVSHLRRGNTKSCGCLRREQSRLSLLKHGRSHTQIYGVWQAMRARCFDLDDQKYPDYGGRGITVCDRWRKNFEPFLADMGERPLGLTLHRIDNNGNYEPGNCCWATPKTQANNTRRNRRMAFGGATLTLTEWAQRLGITPGSLHSRLSKWSLEKALTTAKRK